MILQIAIVAAFAVAAVSGVCCVLMLPRVAIAALRGNVVVATRLAGGVIGMATVALAAFALLGSQSASYFAAS